MYLDLKEVYWWDGIKKDVAKFVFKCLVCQEVKVEDHDTQFIRQFWGKLQEALGTRLNFKTTFHPQTNGTLGGIVWSKV